MQYYRIRFTLNPKLRGSNDYIKEYVLHIPNNKLYWEEPKFIGSIQNEIIDFEPYLLDVELFANAKVNDLIMDGGPVSMKLILSSKLKSILERFRETGMQFFNINIIKNREIHSDYWLLNMYEFNLDYVNFSTSRIIYQEKGENFEETYLVNEKIINVNNLDEFNLYTKRARMNVEVLWIEKLNLNNDVKEDFFILKYVNGGIGYFVSETLKKEIEDAGCTGIEFQPIELSYSEWSAPGGEREKVYGKSF